MSNFAYYRKIFGFLFHGQQECMNELKAASDMHVRKLTVKIMLAVNCSNLRKR